VERALIETLSHPATRTKDLGGSLGTRAYAKAVVANLGGKGVGQ